MAIANVLLVDDEVPFVETMTKRLNKRDLQVSTAFSGLEALEKLDKESHVEVVMLTGHATVETAIEGMRLGAYDYLMKPCDMDVLISKVGGAASRKREQETKIVEARVKEITMRRA